MSKKQSFHKMIEKQICAVYDDAHAKVEKILKDSDAISMTNSYWNKPDDINFLNCGNDVDKYLLGCIAAGYPVIGGTHFVTRAEIEKFKTKTWPKLYAKWKRTAIEPQKQALRDEIKSLQDRLSKLDAIK